MDLLASYNDYSECRFERLMLIRNTVHDAHRTMSQASESGKGYRRGRNQFLHDDELMIFRCFAFRAIGLGLNFEAVFGRAVVG